MSENQELTGAQARCFEVYAAENGGVYVKCAGCADMHQFDKYTATARGALDQLMRWAVTHRAACREARVDYAAIAAGITV